MGAPRTFPLSIPWASCFIFICPFQQFLISQQSLISPDFLPTEKKHPCELQLMSIRQFFLTEFLYLQKISHLYPIHFAHETNLWNSNDS